MGYSTAADAAVSEVAEPIHFWVLSRVRLVRFRQGRVRALLDLSPMMRTMTGLAISLQQQTSIRPGQDCAGYD
jgi:hypothetical protein